MVLLEEREGVPSRQVGASLHLSAGAGGHIRAGTRIRRKRRRQEGALSRGRLRAAAEHDAGVRELLQGTQ